MKTSSIKTTLPKLASIMLLLFLILILPVNVYIQLHVQHQSQRNSTIEMFGQLEQLIQTNEGELKREEQEFKEICIRAADMVAYYIKHSKQFVPDVNGCRELAKKMNVDEIHFFTPEGVAFSGTHSEYYGFTFDSGEQVRFFKPMLEDHSLKLCQDITPNTAEGKEMQYAAVWMDDGSCIVQIGMEPRRLQERMEEKSLKNIVEEMPFELNGYFHILQKNTHTITASTEPDAVGIKLFEKKHIPHSSQVSDTIHKYWKKTRYCIYTKEYKDYILVRMYPSFLPISRMLQSSGILILYVLLGSIGIIAALRWYIQNKLIKNLVTIVSELKEIEEGNLDNIAIKTSVTEFEELLFCINQMLHAVRLNRENLIRIMDKAELPFGFFERNSFYNQTFVNRRLLEILGVEEHNIPSSEQKFMFIQERLNEVEKNTVDGAKNICRYYRHNEEIYLNVEKVVDSQSVTYYVTDITHFWKDANQAKIQSQMDELTGLYNRRGFHEQMRRLFETPDNLGYAAMIMIDADGLKMINDTYGHIMGDRYLKAISDLFRNSEKEKVISARLGGDEFAIFLYGCSSEEEIQKRIQKIKKERGKIFLQEGSYSQTLQFSMGAAFYPENGEDFHVLTGIADERMYQEKKARKSKEEHNVFSDGRKTDEISQLIQKN